MKVNKNRCEWPQDDDLMIKYHDEEWGMPCHNDRTLFEYILLDTFQAGLSWRTILYKRKNFKKAFDNFDYKKIAKYGARERARLIKDAGIIRNRLKIEGTIVNARVFLKIQKEFGSFDKYVWGFVGGKPKSNKWKKMSQIPATSKESDALSKDLKKRGMKFVGSTIIYAFMQAGGLVNDHVVDCFRHKEV
ncbi:DNA-3-methyladenine glycosylase I [Candidatus Campbellbacteria bacterium CG22_combo_CG10-13_8_21_14_all_36_13]|uniref:DNA-3-methyladenine glycosylase I n=1 Tax=Candidatus Campbellbacteria bacterium CG22_combo_CG10-13_8_21_14_all_36_13 TaxID=1974529 RepID=A0A2H0DXR3_9BACT|nr:MAG: DNA-3-methyladenine glycosylase I [Candidatus Campbellbacteria bacterium CG22_combo_CG10-13_8_21_14_all_36_13]